MTASCTVPVIGATNESLVADTAVILIGTGDYQRVDDISRPLEATLT